MDFERRSGLRSADLLPLSQNQMLEVDSSDTQSDCYRAETGSLGCKCELQKSLQRGPLILAMNKPKAWSTLTDI